MIEDPAAPRTAPVSNWNIANAVTCLRIALVPVFAVALFVDDGTSVPWRLIATAIFLLAALTDRLDGELARRRGLITDFGKIADPIADKALIGMALVGLSLLSELSWWVTGVILARELGITLLRFLVIRYGVIAASTGGKLKTVLQIIALSFYLLPRSTLPDVVDWFAVGFMAAAVLVTVVTGLDYVVRAVRMVHERRTTPPARRDQ